MTCALTPFTVRFHSAFVWLLAAGLLASAGPGWANGFRNPPESAAGLSLVGGRYTLVRDASAMAFNPAHLADLDEVAAQVSVNFVRTGAEADTLLGPASAEDNWYTLPSLYAVWPMADGDFVGGLAITAPFGQSTEWSEHGVFRYTAPYFAELQVVNVNPTVASRLTETLSVGVGLDVYASAFEMKTIYPWSGVPGVNPAADGLARFEGDGTGLGGNVGLLWQIGPGQLLALSYRSSVAVDLDGDFVISNVPAQPPGSPIAARSDFATEIEFPAIVALGYALQCNDRLRIGFDLEWLEFSTFDSLDLDIGRNQPLLPPGQSSVRQDWDDSWTAGVAGEWAYDEGWILRGGYIFMETPIPDATFSPTLVDVDQHVLTAGVARQFETGQFSVSYGIALNGDRHVRNNQNPLYNGIYDPDDSHFLSVAYQHTF